MSDQVQTARPSPTSTMVSSSTDDVNRDLSESSTHQPSQKKSKSGDGSQSDKNHNVDLEKQQNRSTDNSDGPSETSTGPQNDKEGEDPWVVKWDGEDDPTDPLNTPGWKKWSMTILLALTCACVTCCSSMAASAYTGMREEFGISEEVAILSVSLFVVGLGTGPLFLGPCSEFVGRSKVLHGSFIAFFLLNLPVAFANHISIHLIFRYLTGFAGSAFLTVSGGLISDTFRNEKVGTPMLLFSAAPFLGPVLGPLIAGFINQNTNWRWTFYVVLIWSAVMLILLLIFVRETLSSELLRRKAKKLRKETGEERWIAPVEKVDRTFAEALKKSIKTPFILLSTQMMVLFLDLWSAMILGILYLSFGGIPYIFREQYGFSLQQTGMTFLGIGTGQVIACLTQPYFNKKYRQSVIKNNGNAPPEERLVPGFYGAILAPLGLLLLGLTCFKNVHWIVPIIMSSFFGMGMVYSYTSTFTYLVEPVSASALASNSFLRSAFAAGFPLFGQQMYRKLGAVGGTCLLGGLMCLAIPLPFIFYRIGARVRAKTAYAAS